MFESPDNKVLSVSQITNQIKRLLENGIPEVWVEGEISNFVHHRSGHMYFSVKDNDAQLRCVMFKGKNLRLDFRPGNGAQVRVLGTVGVWPPQGAYQFYVEQMTPSGLGALHQAFERLKQKLQKEGLFDPRHKKPIPAFPTRIGIVTSPTGAAIRDIVNVISRRYPLVKLIICPARVQGQNAESEIARAIETFDRLPGDQRPDLLIVGRGGGSLEDLWPFNEEVTARAVFNCTIPIISAVGHEIDFTITDFVADLRAPTPSAGAEEAVPDIREIKSQMNRMGSIMKRSVLQGIQMQKLKIDRLRKSQLFRPQRHIEERGLHLDRISDALSSIWRTRLYNAQKQMGTLKESLMENRPERRFNRLKLQLRDHGQRLKDAWFQENRQRRDLLLRQELSMKTFNLDEYRKKLNLLAMEFKGYDPRAIMNRGYAICTDDKGKIISSIGNAPPGSKIGVELEDGVLACDVNDRRRRDE